MGRPIPVLLTVIAVGLGSCGDRQADCGAAWRTTDESPRIELRTLEPANFASVETKLIAEVDRCYQAGQGIPDYPLSYFETWKDSRGHRYLVFDIYGVADIVFVADVDRAGRIVRTGYSTLNF